MKIVFVQVVVLFLALSSFAQNIRVIKKSETSFPKLKKKDYFHLLEKEMDTTRVTFVATLEITPPGNYNLLTVYNKIQNEAKKIGANAFKVQQYNAYGMFINVFFADNEALEKNRELKPRNTFYIFAEGDQPSNYYDFELNGGMKSLPGGTYIEYKLNEGEHVKLKKGNITGTFMWIKWKPDQFPSYYSIHGFYNEAVVKRTRVNDPSQLDKFIALDSDLGAFLVQVLPAKDELNKTN